MRAASGGICNRGGFFQCTVTLALIFTAFRARDDPHKNLLYAFIVSLYFALKMPKIFKAESIPAYLIQKLPRLRRAKELAAVFGNIFKRGLCFLRAVKAQVNPAKTKLM